MRASFVTKNSLLTRLTTLVLRHHDNAGSAARSLCQVVMFLRPNMQAVSSYRALAMFRPRVVAMVCVGLALAVQSYIVLSFIARYAVNLLYMDQWDFYGGLFYDRSWADLFVWQHNSPRMGVGFFFIRLIADGTQWDARAQDFFVGILLIVCALAAILLKVRLTGTLDVFDAAIPFLVLSLRQYEQLVSVGNPSIEVLPLLLLLVFALALQIRNCRARYAALLGINFLMIYTGYGIFLAPITPVVIVLDLWRDPRERVVKLAGLGIALLSLGSFFINWIPTSAALCVVQPTLLAYPAFAASMYGAVLALPALHPASFAVAAVVLASTTRVVIEAVRARSRGPALVLAVLSVFSLLYVIGTALGRACMGPQQAQASRYVALVLPAFLTLYVSLWAITRPGLRALGMGLFAVPIIVLSAFNQHFLDRGAEQFAGKTAWRECYLRFEDIQRCTVESGYEIYPVPAETNMQWKLDYLRDRQLNLFKPD
jgi:hypothetical protein